MTLKVTLKSKAMSKLHKMSVETERNTQIIGDFNTSLLGHDTLGEHKTRNLNNIINKVDITAI